MSSDIAHTGKSETCGLVSILVPAYNHANYISACLHSAIAQTYQNIEVIIVNDGSTDATDSVVQTLLPMCQQRFTRVEYINKANEGVRKSLNLAISKARGDYLYILPSDDAAEPLAIEMLHGFLSQNSDYALAVGDNFIMDSEGERCLWDKHQNNIATPTNASFATFGALLKHRNPHINFNSEQFGCYPSLLMGNYIPNGFFLRTQCIRDVGGYDDKPLLEDHNLMLKLSKYYKLKFIDIPLFSYRWHSNNTAQNRPLMMQLALNTILNEKWYCKSSPELNDILFDAIDYLRPKTIHNKFARSCYKRYLKLTKPLRRKLR